MWLMFEGALIERKHLSFGKNTVTRLREGLQKSWGQLQPFMILCANRFNGHSLIKKVFYSSDRRDSHGHRQKRVLTNRQACGAGVSTAALTAWDPAATVGARSSAHTLSSRTERAQSCTGQNPAWGTRARTRCKYIENEKTKELWDWQTTKCINKQLYI